MQSVEETTAAADGTEEVGWAEVERVEVATRAVPMAEGLGALMEEEAAQAVAARTHPQGMVAAAEVARAAVEHRVVGSVVVAAATGAVVWAADLREAVPAGGKAEAARAAAAQQAGSVVAWLEVLTVVQ